MRVLVVYGSKMGGTAGLADMIGRGLAETGIEPVVRPAAQVRELGEADAVIVAGALYATRSLDSSGNPITYPGMSSPNAALACPRHRRRTRRPGARVQSHRGVVSRR